MEFKNIVATIYLKDGKAVKSPTDLTSVSYTHLIFSDLLYGQGRILLPAVFCIKEILGEKRTGWTEKFPL